MGRKRVTAPSWWICIGQSPTTLTYIYKFGNVARCVMVSHRELKPVLYRGGKRECIRHFRSVANTTA